jgi:hypothetical protein
MKRWLVPIAVGIVLLVAIAGAFVSFSPGGKAQVEAEAEIAELTATVNKFDKARQDAEAKAGQAAAAATKSDKARQDAEAKAIQAAAALTKSEQARQAAEAKAADAEKARQTAAARADDAERARQTAEANAAQVEENVPRTIRGFTLNRNMAANDAESSVGWAAGSFDLCQQMCERANTCNVFSYNRVTGFCYKYTAGNLVRSQNFDSGVRN